MAYASIRFVVLILLSGLSFSAYTHTNVVVIPMGGEVSTLQNVITVSKSGGDFTDPIAAIDSITNASADNPYLVYIGPGVYTLNAQLELKSHVHIVGSGEGITKLTGNISKGSIAGDPSDIDAALVVGASSASMRDITLENLSAGGGNIALFLGSDSTTVSAVTLITDGALHSIGIALFGDNNNLKNVTTDIQGATKAWGVYALLSTGNMFSNSYIYANGGSNSNSGMYISRSSLDLNSVSVIGSGTNSQGIEAYGGNIAGTRMHIIHSYIESDDLGGFRLETTNDNILYQSRIYIDQTTVVGSVTYSDYGTIAPIVKCTASGGSSGIEYNSSCNSI